MDDVTTPASNAGAEVTAPAETQVVERQEVSTPSEPPKTAREALERAFDSTDGAKEAADPGERPRNPDGTFATKPKEETKQEAQKPATPKQEAAPKQEVQPAQEKPKRPAPSRWSKEAQAAWDQLPEVVQAEAERSIAELTQGIEKYKGEFAPLKPYAEQAKAQGTTIDKLFEGYVSWENAFKRDPIAAFRHLLSTVGIDPASAAQALANGGASPQPAAPSIDMTPLYSEITTLKQQLQEIQTRPVMEQVQDFASKSPFFDLLQNDIVEHLRGQNDAGETPDLQKAYDASLAKYPDLAAVVAAKKAESAQAVQPAAPTEQPKTQEAAHTRKASLALTGTSSGSDPASRKPAGSPREALERAAAQFSL